MTLLAALAFIPALAAAKPILGPSDPVSLTEIERVRTAEALVTFSTGDDDDIRVIRFSTVPDLDACFSLAYAAALKTQGQSSATCLGEANTVVGAYYCAWAPEGDVSQPLACRALKTPQNH